MPISAQDFYNLNPTPMMKGIVQVITNTSVFLRRLKFIQVNGFGYKYNREVALGGIAFRNLNGYYNPTGKDDSTINPAMEELAIFGGIVRTDRQLVNQSGARGGRVRNAGTVVTVARGQVALAASPTNYVEVDGSGVVSSNTAGFTAGREPLYQVVAGSASIATVANAKPLLSFIAPGSIGPTLLTPAAAARSVGVRVGTLATTGDAPVTAPAAGRLSAAVLVADAAVAASDTDYWTFGLANAGQAGTGTAALLLASAANGTRATGGAAIAARSARVLTPAALTLGTELNVAANDCLVFTATATGNPAALSFALRPAGLRHLGMTMKRTTLNLLSTAAFLAVVPAALVAAIGAAPATLPTTAPVPSPAFTFVVGLDGDATGQPVTLSPAPATLHVSSLGLQANAGDWVNAPALDAWTFGDVPGRQVVADPTTGRPVDLDAAQVGPVAGYLYEQPGTYVVTLAHTAGGVRLTYARTVVVPPAARKPIYVAPGGSDANSGTDPAHPLATVAAAGRRLADHTAVLLARGGTYAMAADLPLKHEDLLVDCYGDASLPLPVLYRTNPTPAQPPSHVPVFTTWPGQTADVTVRHVRPDASTKPAATASSASTASSPSSSGS